MWCDVSRVSALDGWCVLDGVLRGRGTVRLMAVATGRIMLRNVRKYHHIRFN